MICIRLCCVLRYRFSGCGSNPKHLPSYTHQMDAATSEVILQYIIGLSVQKSEAPASSCEDPGRSRRYCCSGIHRPSQNFAYTGWVTSKQISVNDVKKIREDVGYCSVSWRYTQKKDRRAYRRLLPIKKSRYNQVSPTKRCDAAKLLYMSGCVLNVHQKNWRARTKSVERM
jgi:hypothetical protein